MKQTCSLQSCQYMMTLFMQKVLPTVFFFMIAFLVEVNGTTAARISCGVAAVEQSFTIFQAGNSAAELITVGGSLNQTLIDSLDSILAMSDTVISCYPRTSTDCCVQPLKKLANCVCRASVSL